MKIGAKIVLVTMLIVMISSVHAAVGYYVPSNLRALKNSGAQLHAPLVMLIEEHALKAQKKEYPTGAVGNVTWNLTASLQLGFYPIIVTTSILYNFMTRKQQGLNKKNMRGAVLSQPEWSMYDVVGTSLFLLVPQSYKDIYGLDHVKSENLRDLTSYLPQRSNENYERILTQIAGFPVNMQAAEPFGGKIPEKAQMSYQGDELTKIFQDNPPYVFDVLIHGHGNFKKGGQVCGMTIDATRKTLSLLTTYFNAGVVMLRTCNAGGRHVGMIEMDDLGIRPDHDYILISNAITDAPIGTTYQMSLEWNPQIFSRSARVHEDKHSLKNLLNGVISIDPRPFSVHDISMFPQVWLPHRVAFQTEEINSNVTILDNNEARSMAQSGQPFVTNQQAVLLYPPALHVPLVVNARPYDAEQKAWSRRTHYWNNLPTLLEFLQENQDVLTSIDQSSFPRLSAMMRAGDLQQPFNRNLYPVIVSMLRGEGAHYIKRFEVQSLRAANGVLHAIRDGFFDLARRQSIKTFAIDQVVGNNDITAMLEAVRASQGNMTAHPLERVLGAAEKITLRNVVIASQAFKDEQDEWAQWVSLKFEVNGTAWSFRRQDFEMGGEKIARPWKFVEMSVDALRAEYAQVKQNVGAELHRSMGVLSTDSVITTSVYSPEVIATSTEPAHEQPIEEVSDQPAPMISEPASVMPAPVIQPVDEPVVLRSAPVVYQSPKVSQATLDLLAVVSVPGRGGMQQVQALLSQGADPRYVDPRSKKSLPDIADASGKVQIAKLLRTAPRPQVPVVSVDAEMPVVSQSMTDQVKQVAQPVSIPVVSQATLDLLAVVSTPGRGGMQQVQTLLSQGANPRYVDPRSKMSLAEIADNSGKVQIAKLLRQQGAR